MRRDGGRSRRWPAAAAALLVVLATGAPVAAWADTSPVPADPAPADPAAADPAAATVVVAAVPSAAVHDGAGCTGPETATVAGDFSVSVRDLLGGPLAAVTVRSDTLVVASAVAVLDASGAGCADLAATAPGSYQVTASIGDATATTTVAVPAPPDPPAPVDPAPGPDPGVAPPTDVVAPTDPPPTTDAPQPDPSGSAPARFASPAPAEPEPAASAPTVSLADTGPAGSRAASTDHPSRAHQDAGRTVAAPAAPSAPAPAPSASASATTAVTAVLDSTKRAGSKVVSVLVSSDRPTAVTIIGFIVIEVLGIALLVAFVALVASRAPRRRG